MRRIRWDRISSNGCLVDGPVAMAVVIMDVVATDHTAKRGVGSNPHRRQLNGCSFALSAALTIHPTAASVQTAVSNSVGLMRPALSAPRLSLPIRNSVRHAERRLADKSVGYAL